MIWRRERGGDDPVLTEEDGEREEVDDGLVDVRGESLASL